jgi:hypothetical protein
MKNNFFAVSVVLNQYYLQSSVTNETELRLKKDVIVTGT